MIYTRCDYYSEIQNIWRSFDPLQNVFTISSERYFPLRLISHYRILCPLVFCQFWSKSGRMDHNERFRVHYFRLNQFDVFTRFHRRTFNKLNRYVVRAWDRVRTNAVWKSKIRRRCSRGIIDQTSLNAVFFLIVIIFLPPEILRFLPSRMIYHLLTYTAHANFIIMCNFYDSIALCSAQLLGFF